MPIGQADVGKRVTIRYASTDGRSATDVVGRLLMLDARAALVERRDGTPVEVDRQAIILSRVVPTLPRRSRRARDIHTDQLTAIASRGWPAPVSEALGAWQLRAAGGFTGRANSAAVHGEPGMELAEALEAVERFYARQELPALAQVVQGSRWDNAFETAGWVPTGGALGGAVVRVADLRTVAPDPDPDPDADAIVAAHASDEWLRLYHRVEDPAAARSVLEGPSTVGFVQLETPVAAIGRVVVTGEWAGLAGVEVLAPRRREGLARRIVETSIAWALARGADKAYLQTTSDNVAAIELYRPYGFEEHHRYRYLQPSPTRSHS